MFTLSSYPKPKSLGIVLKREEAILPPGYAHLSGGCGCAGCDDGGMTINSGVAFPVGILAADGLSSTPGVTVIPPLPPRRHADWKTSKQTWRDPSALSVAISTNTDLGFFAASDAYTGSRSGFAFKVGDFGLCY